MAAEFPIGSHYSEALHANPRGALDTKTNVHESNIVDGPGGGTPLEQFTTAVVSTFKTGSAQAQKELRVVRTSIRCGELEQLENHLHHLKEKALTAVDERRTKQSNNRPLEYTETT